MPIFNEIFSVDILFAQNPNCAINPPLLSFKYIQQRFIGSCYGQTRSCFLAQLGLPFEFTSYNFLERS